MGTGTRGGTKQGRAAEARAKGLGKVRGGTRRGRAEAREHAEVLPGCPRTKVWPPPPENIFSAIFSLLAASTRLIGTVPWYSKEKATSENVAHVDNKNKNKVWASVT